MITKEYAKKFADEWIAAWNSHDLARILSHYANDFEMSTPFIPKLMGIPGGSLKGKEAVGAYWGKALEKMPELRFELI
jgi:ketosteroid isomerase-like protein